ncbi:fatty acid desaturase family protein [Cellulomonas soli]|uniref:Fatty acid desaturase n=1 Tax=Cellulomonas soli TaxID=931535 RepID=A0A512PDY3_9CELL|nr:acyl-CoA desaturase [Cellulomonas soli]NYI59090.1 fatty acid desaturase [Cellulomonas soli]GEP69419.1 fatty acid desaturase [Cellulomonas soli]
MTGTDAVRPGVLAPPRTGDRREQYVSDFTALTQRVQQAGFMRRAYGYYWTKLIGLTAAGLGLAVVFVLVGDTWWQLVTATALALLMTQIAFLGHDAAHRQIFVSGGWNEWVSLVVVNLYAGMGLGWWQHKHTKHHAAPNTVGTDPDIDPGIVAFTSEAVEARRTPLTRWLTERQGWFFYPLLLLEGLNLHVQGMRRVLGRRPVKRRWVELSFITARLSSYVVLVFLVLPPGKAAAFIGVQLAVFGLTMGLAFAPNHIGMPVVPRGVKVDFLRRQVLMSRNISGGRGVDTLMGGLNFQIEHHLFPSMARPHLRRVAPLVRAHCDEIGVGYTSTTLAQAYKAVTSHINQVGRGATDVWACPLATQLRV